MLEGLDLFVELDVLFHEGLDLELTGVQGFRELGWLGVNKRLLMIIFISWLVLILLQLILCLHYPPHQLLVLEPQLVYLLLKRL